MKLTEEMRDRARAVALGAAIGDALGMPYEGFERQGRTITNMTYGRLPAGTFTDDTEMALALAQSLLHAFPLDPEDLAGRFETWFISGPNDVGGHTRAVLDALCLHRDWWKATVGAQATHPNSAGNGSVMRCWPVALACVGNQTLLVNQSELQSMVTHMHPDCMKGAAFINLLISELMMGVPKEKAVAQAAGRTDLSDHLKYKISNARNLANEDVRTSG